MTTWANEVCPSISPLTRVRCDLKVGHDGMHSTVIQWSRTRCERCSGTGLWQKRKCRACKGAGVTSEGGPQK